MVLSALITSGCGKSSDSNTSQTSSASQKSNQNLDQQLQASGVFIQRIDGNYGYAIDTSRDPNIQIDLLKKYIHRCEESAKVAPDSASASDLKERAREAALALNELSPGISGGDSNSDHALSFQKPDTTGLHYELASVEAHLSQMGASFQEDKLIVSTSPMMIGSLSNSIQIYIQVANFCMSATSDPAENSKLKNRIQSASSVLNQIYAGAIAVPSAKPPLESDAEGMHLFLENFEVNEHIHKSNGGKSSSPTTSYRISIKSKKQTPLNDPNLIENLKYISKRHSSNTSCTWKSHLIPFAQGKLYHYELEISDDSQKNCLDAADAQLATYLLTKIKTDKVKVLSDGTLAFSANARAH